MNKDVRVKNAVAKRFFSDSRTAEDGELFFRLYGNKIRLYMKHLDVPENDFDDFFQDFALKLYEMRPEGYKDEGQFERWLYVLLKNFHVNRIIRRKMELVFVDVFPHASCVPDNQLNFEELVMLLWHAMESLTEVQKRTIVMVYYDGMRQEEICRAESITVSTLNKRLRGAKKNLDTS